MDENFIKNIWLPKSIGLQNIVRKVLESGFRMPLHYDRKFHFLYGCYYHGLGAHGELKFIPEHLFCLPEDLRHLIMEIVTTDFIKEKLNGVELIDPTNLESIFEMMNNTGLKYVPIELVQKYILKDK